MGFYGVAHHDAGVGAEVTFEIILHEPTNDIEIFYGRTHAARAC